MSELLTPNHDIRQNGYTSVQIDLSKNDMQNAIDKYMGYLALGDEFHQITRYFTNNRGDGDFGQYTRRAGLQGMRGEIQDNKDIFHFGASTRQIVEHRLAGNMPQDMRDFLNASEEIYWAAQRTKRKIIPRLSNPNSDLTEVLQSERNTLNDVLRFIAYYPSTDKLAKGHFDRSAATLAIGESHEGLRIAPGQNGLFLNVDEQYMQLLESQLKPVEHREGEAKFFLGAGWNRLDDTYKAAPNLPLAWHDVVPSEKQVNEQVMRWAIVMFINPYAEMLEYAVPTPTETRPYKQLGRLGIY